MQGVYASACDPMVKSCAPTCLTCPASCNSAGCKNCLMMCNNTVFDGLCGNDCLGYPVPLCACCNNCPLLWYAGCCQYCYIADLSVMTSGNKQKWKDTAYPLLFWYVIAEIFEVLGRIPKIGTIFNLLSQLIMALVHIAACVSFGKAATEHAKVHNWAYEGAECCEGCGFNLNCVDCFACSGAINPMCCLTYWCCFHCHFVQVGRSAESDPEAITNIKAGRPDECAECCDCWDPVTGHE